jgi:sec-independent protein translocase protein TatA
VTAVNKGDTTVHFGPSAEIFGVDGIIILVVVVLVLFGSTQIPKLARSLGSAQKEFKKGIEEGSAEDGQGKSAMVEAAPPAAVTPPAPSAPPVVQAPPPVEGIPGPSS